MSRHNLQKQVVISGLALLTVALVLFLSSPGFHEKDRPASPRIDIATLRAGSFIEERLETSRVFVLRDFDGRIHVFAVPFWD